MLEEKLGEKKTRGELEKLEIEEGIKKRKKILMGLFAVYTGLLITSLILLSDNKQPNNYKPLKKPIEKIDSSKYSVIVDSTKYLLTKYRKDADRFIYTKN